MATMAIDQYAAHAHLAHLSEGDLERSPVSVRRRVASDRAGHAATESLRRQESNYRFVGSRGSLELLAPVTTSLPCAWCVHAGISRVGEAVDIWP